jgi:uncharacterized protein YkwD
MSEKNGIKPKLLEDKMKKYLRLTLITGIIFTMLITATGITASASCPLTSLFERFITGRATNNNNNSLFGGGSPFSFLFGNGGGNSNNGTANNGGCPITNILGGGNTLFGGNNNTPVNNNNCPPVNNNNCPPANNNNCPPANNNCPPASDNTCTTNDCEPVKPPEQPAQTPQNCATYAEEVLELVNAERASRGLSALELDGDLCAAAEVRAAEVLRRFSHTRPNGASWLTVFRDFEINYNVAGENIAKGFRNAEAVVRAWMNSSGHRANILNPDYEYMGVGKNGTGWGQLFKG